MIPLDHPAPECLAIPATTRDAAGRFRPGCSGNPKGKPKGAPNRSTLWQQAVRAGEALAAARVVIDQATGGDVVAARFLTDRLAPRPRTRPLPLDLASDAPYGASCAAVFAAFAAGAISPDEAMAAARYIDHARDQRATAAAEARAAADAQARRDWAASAEAERLDRLEDENDALRAEIAALKAERAAAAPAPAEPAIAAAASAPDDRLYSPCIATPPDAAPPPRAPAAAQPIPATPMVRRRSAMRYWAGKPPRRTAVAAAP
jgi:hypothetical protein